MGTQSVAALIEHAEAVSQAIKTGLNGNSAYYDSGDTGESGQRPIIDITDRDLERTSAKAWAAITMANDPPTRFRLSDLLVRVVSSDGDAVAEPLTADRLRYDLGRCARWYRSTDEGPKSAAPPLGIVRDMVAYPVA